MEFFKGFKWAVPEVFSGALSNCKFEEGDVLYDSQAAYKEWESAIESTNYYIKVKSPRRTVTVTKGEKESVPIANWNSEVIIELKDLSDESPVQLIETTQGKMFTLLWKGDLKILIKDEPIPPPLFLKDVKKKLKETVGVCKTIANGRLYYIMAYDPTNEVSRQKHLKVLSTLLAEHGCNLFQLTPEESGFKGWENISPVICTKLYVVYRGGYNDILETLKKVLYKPSAESKRGNFRLSTHGILEPV